MSVYNYTCVHIKRVNNAWATLTLIGRCSVPFVPFRLIELPVIPLSSPQILFGRLPQIILEPKRRSRMLVPQTCVLLTVCGPVISGPYGYQTTPLTFNFVSASSLIWVPVHTVVLSSHLPSSLNISSERLSVKTSENLSVRALLDFQLRAGEESRDHMVRDYTEQNRTIYCSLIMTRTSRAHWETSIFSCHVIAKSD